MARILADKEIGSLIGSVIIDGDASLLNPNGIELRLGTHVLFHTTGEEKELGRGMFLKVSPGETVAISSLELIDFSRGKVEALMPGFMLMGLITPTTTMMREGISQVATKIDAGFRGRLNWGLRNGSTRDLLVQYAEPIFKLTIFALAGDEAPEIEYGKRPDDRYQDTEGIMRSTRRIPVDIPKSKIICSSIEKLDPKKQLKEAGYPFDHIATELIDLHGKFEVVSSDVRLMKDEFNKKTAALSDKIEVETRLLASKIDDTPKNVMDKVETLFDRKFLRVVGVVFGGVSMLYGGVTYLQGTTLGGEAVAFIALVVGSALMLLTYFLSRK